MKFCWMMIKIRCSSTVRGPCTSTTRTTSSKVLVSPSTLIFNLSQMWPILVETDDSKQINQIPYRKDEPGWRECHILGPRDPQFHFSQRELRVRWTLQPYWKLHLTTVNADLLWIDGSFWAIIYQVLSLRILNNVRIWIWATSMTWEKTTWSGRSTHCITHRETLKDLSMGTTRIASTSIATSSSQSRLDPYDWEPPREQSLRCASKLSFFWNKIRV